MTEKKIDIWGGNPPFQPLDEASTPQEMRAAIEKAMYHNPIIRNAMTAARCGGLSAEDTYTVLAYHALQMHSKVSALALDVSFLASPPRVIITNGNPE